MVSRRFLALLAILNLALAAFVDPNPISVCRQGAGPEQTTCPNASGCCSGGECCAGGCCPSTAMCINKGRGDEGCCPLDDATSCGAILPTKTGGICTTGPKTSVRCGTSESSWDCPADNACGVRFGACFSIPNICTTTVTGGGSPTTSPTGSGFTSAGAGGPAATTSALPSGSDGAVPVEFSVRHAVGLALGAVIGAVMFVI